MAAKRAVGEFNLASPIDQPDRRVKRAGRHTQAAPVFDDGLVLIVHASSVVSAVLLASKSSKMGLPCVRLERKQVR